MKLLTRAKKTLSSDGGMETLEKIILISVALVIAVVLFVFRGQITSFITKAGKQVKSFEVD